jgi:hypothetical protein
MEGLRKATKVSVLAEIGTKSSQISLDKPARVGKVKCLCEAGTGLFAYIMK